MEAERVEPVRSRTTGVEPSSLGGCEDLVGVGVEVVDSERGTLVVGEEGGRGGDGSEEEEGEETRCRGSGFDG